MLELLLSQHRTQQQFEGQPRTHCPPPSCPRVRISHLTTLCYRHANDVRIDGCRVVGNSGALLATFPHRVLAELGCSSLSVKMG